MSSETKAAAAKYHRRVLSETADRLLTEYGYDGMNMNMLAKEAGYSKATVYVYFESKDEIVRQLSIERLKLVRAELALVVKNDMDADEKLAEVRSVLDELATEDGVYFDFICSGAYASGGATESERALRELINGIVDDLTAIAPRERLLRLWYGYYGRIKTQAMFERSDAETNK